MNRNRLAIATLLAGLSACASGPSETWVKAGASADALASDRGECVLQARHGASDNAQWARPDVEVRKCLEAKGWRMETAPAN